MVIDIKYQDCIQRVLDYIEDNLQYNLTNTELANIAGYSEYHFLRIFRNIVHLTPADYIRKRRITEIVRRMEREERPISDIAFEFGFNSKENFVRAFKAEHHILPTEYKTWKNSLKLYERMVLEPDDFHVNAELLVLEPFKLVAYPSDENFVPNFWNKYNVNQWSKKLSGGATVEDYGVSDWHPETRKLDYYIGIREEAAKGDLSGTVTLNIEGGLYAVFKTPPTSHFDFVNTIHKTWEYIARVWLPENGYVKTGGYELESYAEESREFSEIIYIPIKKEKECNEEIKH